MAPQKKRKKDAVASSLPADPSQAAPQTPSDRSKYIQTPKKRKPAPKDTPTTSRRHTRGLTTDAARKAVFNTSELLESILVCLPPKTLFGVQRVSKQFQAIITTSIPIQEKMFLRLRNTPERSWLSKMEITADGNDWYFVESADSSAQQALLIPTQLNPFLNLDNKHLASVSRTQGWIESATLNMKNPMSLATLEHRASSILSTYISDPPSNSVEVYFDYRVQQGGIETWRRMSDGEHGDGTIGDSVRNALEGYGREVIKWKGPGLSPNLDERQDGRLANSRQIIERFEDASGPGDKSKKGGFSAVNFGMPDMVVPTEVERAAVKSRRVRDSSNPANEK